MPFKIQQLSGENIIIVTLVPPVDMATDIVSLQQKVVGMIGNTNEVYYLVADLSQVQMGFHEVVEGLATSTAPGAALHSSPIKIVTYVVGTDEMVRLIANAFDQEHYGATGKLPLFDNINDALADIRDR